MPSQDRVCIAVFISGLVLSGVIAFPLVKESAELLALLRTPLLAPMSNSIGLLPWIERVSIGLQETDTNYPFLLYGTDWLAFAHLAIAVAFVGAPRDPVRNRWLVTYGLIACPAVVPLALIAGFVRQIPFGWRLLDCGFGVFGAAPLLTCKLLINKLADDRWQLSTNGA